MRSAYLAKSVTQATVRALNYSREVEILREKALTDSAIVCLGEIAKVPSASNYIFRQVDCAPGHGEEILTQADMFAAEPSGRVVRRDLMPNPEVRRIRRGQILIAGAGQMEETNLFGRSILSDARLVGKVLCGDAIMLNGDEESDKFLYLYAFLCSPYGVRFVRSTAYGSSIPRPRLDLLNKLPIPIPDAATLKRIADLVRSTVTNRELYLSEVQAARACLEALPEMQEAIRLCQERKARCAVWDGNLPTMTAWNYASTGKAMIHLRKQWSSRLRDCIEPRGIFRGPRFVRIPCNPPHGVDFWSQRDIHMIRPIPSRIAKPKVSDRLLFVPEHALLVPGIGQFTEGALFGKVAITTSETVSAAITEHIFRIYTLPQYALQLYAFFSTVVGLRLLRTVAVGNTIPVMRVDLLEDLPVPMLDSTTAKAVDTHMRQALAAKVNASNAEKEAIRIIEDEVLPQWLA
jgi:hypothetical protein